MGQASPCVHSYKSAVSRRQYGRGIGCWKWEFTEINYIVIYRNCNMVEGDSDSRLTDRSAASLSDSLPLAESKFFATFRSIFPQESAWHISPLWSTALEYVRNSFTIHNRGFSLWKWKSKTSTTVTLVKMESSWIDERPRLLYRLPMTPPLPPQTITSRDFLAPKLLTLQACFSITANPL